LATLPDPVPVFVNESAGGRRQALEDVQAAFREAGVAAELQVIDPSRLADEIADAAGRGAAIVAVGGGDGSIRTAAEVLAGSETVLAPLPLGTLNHFARRLGLGELKEAVEAIASRRVVLVPLGVVDDRVFLNTATFGLYAEVVRRREQLERWLTKWPAAAVASAATLLRMRSLDVVLDVDGKALHRRTPLVWVGVGRSSFPFAHEAPLHGEKAVLEVVVVRPGRGPGALRLIVRLLVRLIRRKAPGADPGLEVLHARSVLLRARHHVGSTLDGEVFRWDPPLLVSIQEDALRVVAPRPLQPPEDAPAGSAAESAPAG
jgi:diacylglycerol kinase family enzyme